MNRFLLYLWIVVLMVLIAAFLAACATPAPTCEHAAKVRAAAELTVRAIDRVCAPLP